MSFLYKIKANRDGHQNNTFFRYFGMFSPFVIVFIDLCVCTLISLFYFEFYSASICNRLVSPNNHNSIARLFAATCLRRPFCFYSVTSTRSKRRGYRREEIPVLLLLLRLYSRYVFNHIHPRALFSLFLFSKTKTKNK